MSNRKPYRVRFAPSPTGHVHLGSARTALYDFLIAQQTGGQFILRIEDTDRKRLVEGAEQELIDSLKWLGIEYDEGPDVGGPYAPYRQSERKEIYQQFANDLIAMGKAYPCFCTTERLSRVREENLRQKLLPHYDGLCRSLPKDESQTRIEAGEPYVIRFRSPKEGTTIVQDLLRGNIAFENKNLDDFILVKSDGWALYHLAAIVDDYLMKITHVIRGSEWLSTSPLHALIWRAFGWEEPVWVHLSVFLKPSGKGKMSKREAAQLSQDGYSIFIKDLEELGYLPEAVNNWIALMGWSYDDRTEFFTMQDLIDKFSLGKLNPSPAAINFSKLDHFNKLHIKALTYQDLAQHLLPFFEKQGIKASEEKLADLGPVLNERLTTLDEAVDLCKFIFTDEIPVKKDSLAVGGNSDAQMQQMAMDTIGLLEVIQDWKAEILESALQGYMESHNLTPKEYYSFLREAISGQRVTPPLFNILTVLGKEKTLERIHLAGSLFA